MRAQGSGASNKSGMLPKPWALDVIIFDLSLAGLNAPSVVRLKLFTLDYSLIVRRIGHLGEADSEAVIESIEKLFNVTWRSS